VGLLPMSPINATSGNIAGGMIDSNDNGRANSYSSVTGTYKLNANGSWGMTLTFGSGPTTLDFDFYVLPGPRNPRPNRRPDPLRHLHRPGRFDPPRSSGSMAYQVPMSSGYTNASFNGTSVSALTGANANVSLTVGQTDGTSGGTGGTGGLTGSFDQNNNGNDYLCGRIPRRLSNHQPLHLRCDEQRRTIHFLPAGQSDRKLACESDSVCSVRQRSESWLPARSEQLVGDHGSHVPATHPQELQLHFYRAAGRLRRRHSQQQRSQHCARGSELAGHLARRNPTRVYVAGTQNPNSVALAGSYTVNDTPPGTGTITLTSSPLPPLGANYVIYAIDALPASSSNDVITDFMMMATCVITPPATTCTAPPSSIIFAQQ